MGFFTRVSPISPEVRAFGETIMAAPVESDRFPDPFMREIKLRDGADIITLTEYVDPHTATSDWAAKINEQGLSFSTADYRHFARTCKAKLARMRETKRGATLQRLRMLARPENQ